jgi:hypothetical protein
MLDYMCDAELHGRTEVPHLSRAHFRRRSEIDVGREVCGNAGKSIGRSQRRPSAWIEGQSRPRTKAGGEEKIETVGDRDRR